jgi:hypothetical protein
MESKLGEYRVMVAEDDETVRLSAVHMQPSKLRVRAADQ